MKIELISEMIEANGKTVRENNLEVKHDIPVGTLVEIIPWDEECGYEGMRLYVTAHGRDCDGTPLYTLGCNQEGSVMTSGFGQESLRVIILEGGGE